MIKKLGVITILMTVLSIALAAQQVPTVTREPATINFSRVSMELQVGQTSSVRAFVYDDSGKLMTGLAVGWLPGTTSTCVTVDQGLVTATHLGQCSVSAFVVSTSGRVVLARCPIDIKVTE